MIERDSNYRLNWLLWVLTWAVGWAIAFPMGRDFAWPGGWLLAGSAASLCQALLLRHWQSAQKIWLPWLAASLGGWAIFAWILQRIPQSISDLAAIALVLAAALPAGVLQWLVLRRNFGTTAWWTLVNSLSVLSAMLFTLLIFPYAGGAGWHKAVLVGLSFGLIQGCVSAAFLAELLRKRRTVHFG